MLYSLFGRAANPGQDIYWFGNWKMSNTKFITSMMIGNQLCDRYQLSLNDDEDLNYWADNYIQCWVSPEMEGGFYDITFTNNLGIGGELTEATVAHPKRN